MLKGESMKVLLAVDGSPCSDMAIGEVARLCLSAGTVVLVVSADAPADPALIRGVTTAYDDIVRQQRAEVSRRLNVAVSTLQRLAPHLTVLPKLLEGNPKDAIVGEAEHWGADLIVVGSHGYGPIRRFFLGSVSLFVAHNAPCSVLIARCQPTNCPTPAAAAPTA